VFFILGNQRSGTTLLRLMLTCHGSVVVPPECHFMLWLYKRFSSWHFNEGLVGFVDALYDCTKFETWGLDREYLLSYLQAHGNDIYDYGSLVKAVYECYAQRHFEKGSLCGDKNSLWIEMVWAIEEIVRSPKYIYLVRDGRDVACSYRELAGRTFNSQYQPRLPSDIPSIARAWDMANRVLFSFLVGKDENRVLRLHYEDLVECPEEALRACCGFLSIEYEPRMLNFHEVNRSLGLEPKEFLQWKEKTLTEVNAMSVGRYRRELTNPEIREFNEIAGESLRDHGYAT